MPPQVNEPEEQRRTELTADDPWPMPDDPVDPNGNGNDDEDIPLAHDELVALRSSRHVARRPRRRKRWPWVVTGIAVLVGLATYAFIFFAWPVIQDFLIERNVESAAAGYPNVATSFSDGVAKLSGEIPTSADADVLLSAVGAIEGVETVQSDLSVAVDTSIDPLALAVREALANAGLTGVSALVDGATVTLIGSVAEAGLIDTASAIAVDVEGVSQVLNRIIVASDAAAAAQQVLASAGFESVAVNLNENVAILTGAVASEDLVLAAAEVVMGLPGIEKIDNRIVVGEVADPPTSTTPTVPANTTLAAALEAAGLDTVSVSMTGDVVYLDGVVPFEVLEDGYFGFVDQVKTIVASFSDSATVVNRLRLRGNEQQLRAELTALLEERPVVFLSGSSDLTLASQETLDRAAKIILSQPGLQIFIAGHTDSSGAADVNEQLARDRANAVYGYLVSSGVPANRMAVISYGEMFPGQGASAADDRRIEFEVGP